MLPYVLAWLSQLDVFGRFDHEDEGQGMVEYGLILILVSVVAITAVRLVGTSIIALFTQVAGLIAAA